MSIASILQRNRLVFALASLLALAGLLSLHSMPRQEDPSFPYRAGIITAAFPGADADSVARLVAQTLERELLQVEGVEEVRSTSRQDVAVIAVQLFDSIYATDEVWNRVRAALQRAEPRLPPGAQRPVLDDRIIGADMAVYGVLGGDAMARRDAAILLRDRLAVVPGVASAETSGDPGESVAITVDRASMLAMGLSPGSIAAAFAERSGPSLLGSLSADGRILPMRMSLDYASLDELRALPIRLPSGAVIPLKAIASVERSTPMPATPRAFVDGEPAIAVAVRAARNGVNVLQVGERVRQEVALLAADIAPLEIREIFYEPHYTEVRMQQLLASLLTAMGLILLVLVFAMGPRPALVVATILPLVTASSVAIYAIGGGVLQQIVIIGMVVALGILVDNAIVMVEGIQRRLDAGEARNAAMLAGVGELAGPLLAATGTTLAAFLPLLLSTGNTADFTRGIPLAITLSLVVSYLFAVLVTPLLAAHFLKPSPATTRPAKSERVAELAVWLTLKHPRKTLCGGLLLLLASLACFPLLQQQFFPEADRASILVEVLLPSGSHPDQSEEVSRQVAEWLRHDPAIGRIDRFVGYAGPTFYYNLQRAPRDSARARLLVETAGLDHNRELVERLGLWAAEALPGVDLIPVILRQGPPTVAPIELLVFHPEREALAEAVQTLTRLLVDTEGTRNVRHTLGNGVPSLQVDLLGGGTDLLGANASEVAQWLAASTQGWVLGSYRAGPEPVPVRLHFSSDQRTHTGELLGLPVALGAEGALPLAQVARLSMGMQPGIVERREQRQVASVSAEMRAGYGAGNVLAELQRTVATQTLPPGTSLQFAGEAEASGKANQAILRAAPLGALVFLFFILVQFNSMRRVGLVMLALPFALTGVFPALWLAGQAFGFNSLQGVIALIGITVNNAILLVSAADARRGNHDAEHAIAEALRRRTRPILLTTATTITGLLPLVWSPSTLWPPLAWAMIGGLIGSAILSLTALPVLTRWVLRYS